ncbi:MAG: tRNA N6-adenosine threonylcarbamoyltransferase [Parcubacteria group bacterium Athens1014_10]|nr:MAG: tRNA N6-adenosine threonylcarbamoyltransferase [Parcubacteria group bacterium Athens1014_10]TSD05124.1 MAG: tRNA N6-adenosine threonylcarbamoyltransferase [Parcubacteria group bacterium Athens0714_12]
MIILAIETSCDETALCLLEAKNGSFNILSNLVSSQTNIHRKYGGIVPEVAARKHLEIIIPLIEKSLKNLPKNLKIDYLAVTNGPGLITSLLVGVETAKTLSYVWQKPLIAVNHLEGHIYANWLTDRGDGKPRDGVILFAHPRDCFVASAEAPRNDKEKVITPRNDKNVKFPALCLVVSGGHTELVLMKNHLKYQKIGQTLDDAAGECFDKVAKLLNIGYPGGPIISKLAESGNPYKYNLPRPMSKTKNYNFSFSGLKTAALYQSRKIKSKPKNFLEDFCASFQQAVVDVLIEKTIRAAKEYKVKSIILGGGVVANKKLREDLKKQTAINLPEVNLFIPELKFCTDNAAMIGAAAYFHIAKKDFSDWQKIKTDPNLEL